MSDPKQLLLSALLVPAAAVTSLTASAPPANAVPLPLAATVRVVGATASEVKAPVVKVYTMAQVKKHNKRTNCWTVVGKNVYKLTSFVKKHPGGSGRIAAMCGKNATAAFRAQHGSVGKANRVLKSYKIGVLG